MIKPHTNILETSSQKLVINMAAYVLQAATTKFLLMEKSIGNIKKSLSSLQGGHTAHQHCCLENCGT